MQETRISRLFRFSVLNLVVFVSGLALQIYNHKLWMDTADIWHKHIDRTGTTDGVTWHSDSTFKLYAYTGTDTLYKLRFWNDPAHYQEAMQAAQALCFYNDLNPSAFVELIHALKYIKPLPNKR